MPSPRAPSAAPSALAAVAAVAVSLALAASASAQQQPQPAAAITCEVRTSADGPDTYVLNGAPEGKFSCLAVVKDNPPPAPKEVTVEGMCNLASRDTVTSYTPTADATSLECVYECRPATLRCLESPSKDDTECACTSTGVRPVVVPITNDVAMVMAIQSASSSGMRSTYCDQKEAGDPVGPQVNCHVLTKDEAPEKLQRAAPGMCSMKPNPKVGETYTVFEKLLGTDMACQYVCRPDNAVKCTGEMVDVGNGQELCECSASGVLMPKLERLDDSEVSRMVTRTDGSKSFDADGGCFVREDGVDTCGACGRCVDGACELRARDLREQNVCPCGSVCPADGVVAARPDGERGSPIECEQNSALGDCEGDGTRVPDMCLESSDSDLEDQCVCARTHREKLGLGDNADQSTCVPIE